MIGCIKRCDTEACKEILKEIYSPGNRMYFSYLIDVEKDMFASFVPLSAYLFAKEFDNYNTELFSNEDAELIEILKAKEAENSPALLELKKIVDNEFGTFVAKSQLRHISVFNLFGNFIFAVFSGGKRTKKPKSAFVFSPFQMPDLKRDKLIFAEC